MLAFTYYMNTNDEVVSHSVDVFMAAQLFSPRFVKTSRPNAGDVDRIRRVPFLSADNIIQSLKDELPGQSC